MDSEGTAGHCLIDAELVGGPADLPTAIRRQQADDHTRTIKIMHYGGYEHFERDDHAASPDRAAKLIFRWTMRTKIAE